MGLWQFPHVEAVTSVRGQQMLVTNLEAGLVV